MCLKSLLDKHRKEIITFTQEIIKNPSVDGSETAVCELIADKLAEYGIGSKFVGGDRNRLNLLTKLRSNPQGKTLLFNSHTDVVTEGDKKKWRYNPFSGKLVGDKIYGRGAADMKGGIAAIVLAAIVLKETKMKFNGKIVFSFTSNEENPQKRETGIQHLLKKDLIKADAAIIAEPGTKYLNIGSRGVYRFKLTTYGRSWHTGRLSPGGINAVVKMAKFLLALERYKLNFRQHNLFPPPKITPGTIISGGSSVNIVPDKCTAVVDCRLSFDQTKASVSKDITTLLTKLKKEDQEFRAKMEEIFYISPAITNLKHPLIAVLQEQAEKVLGKKPFLKISGPAGDNNFLIEAGISTVLFGPDGENFHSENEFVYADSIFDVARIFVNTATEYLR